MLNTLRKLNENHVNQKPLIEGFEIPHHLQSKENFDDATGNSAETPKSDDAGSNITVINDVEVKLVSTDQMDMQLMDDQKTAISGIIDTFRQQVSQIATLDPGFTLSPSQIRFDGEIGDFDLHFTYVVGEQQGLYCSSDMSEITPEYIALITKMAKFDQMFRDAMEPLITQRQNN